ncbi:DUF692 family multinuclear iron-containing protein [Paraburkholderia phytofirmans]
MGNSTVTTAVGRTDRPLHAIPAAHGLAWTRFRHQHLSAILADGLSNGFFDVHAENPMSVGAPSHRTLAAIREHYPLYIHGVRTSIGATGAFLRFAQATGKVDP